MKPHVTIRVQNAWEHNKTCIWLVETLLQAMFQLRDTMRYQNGSESFLDH